MRHKRTRAVIIGFIAISVSALVYFALFFYSDTSPRASLVESNLYTNNWSGYAAALSNPAFANEKFDSISASWVVPEVAATPAPAYSSVWIGIGGDLTNNKIIQAGTEEDVRSDGSKDYYAWYEALPRPAVNVGRVLPGDLIRVQLKEAGSGSDFQSSTATRNWHIIMSKESMGTISKLSDTVVETRATTSESGLLADFIVEAPALVSAHTSIQTLKLANFGTVSFTNCTTNLGVVGSSSTNLYRFYMTSDGTKDGNLQASPSEISRNGFSVSRLGLDK